MNLFLFNSNDSAAIYGIGTYLTELTQALKDAGIKIHIVHLHSVRPEFEIEITEHIENWFIPEVNNHNTFSGDIQKLEAYCRNVAYLGSAEKFLILCYLINFAYICIV
jgi:transketolase C-terminal domain/subunit